MTIKPKNFYLIVLLSVVPLVAFSRKHPVHGRYTRHIETYEISVPHKLTFTGDFISFELPHFYERKFESHRKKRSPVDPDALHLGVHVNNRHHHLVLWPNYALVSPALVIEVQDLEGLKNTNFQTLPDQKLCYYTGMIKGQRDSRAALSTCDGLVGYITLNNQRFFIEPLEDHEPNEQGHYLHVVYKRDTPEELDDFDSLFYGKDVNSDRKCRTDDKEDEIKDVDATLTNKGINKRSSNTSSDGTRYIETLIVCDQRFLEYHRDLNRERYILTVFNMAADYLHDASIGQQLDLVLIRLLYLDKQEKELDINVTHNAQKTLLSFCKWQQKFNLPDGKLYHSDIALLLTRLDLCYGKDCEVVGQSFIGTPCKAGRNCAYCEDNGLELGLVIAHQIGHLLGASHDDKQSSECSPDDPDDKTPYVMSPKTNLSAIRWSSCSRDHISYVISNGLAECFLNRPPPTPYTPKPVLPGVIYDWTSQCQLIVPGSSACPTQESGAVLCDELRCMQPSEGAERGKLECFSVGKPPADGTKCDENMWCFQGKCVRTGKRPETIDGGWSEWEEWSECTRSCGLGVTYALRKCNNPLPVNGGRYCDGDGTRYKICHPEDCPENSTSFRQQQCDAFNDVPNMDGSKHTYKAFINPESPCSLWCTNEEDESDELDTVVKDGTRCKPGTKNVCVNGACWKVGCDNMLNSAAIEDACGTCNGDGTGCKIYQETFKEVGDKDYFTVTVLPTGVRKVIIEELAPSQNVIAITDKTEKKFYLNGKYLEQADGVYKFSKVEGVYMHTAPNKEKLTIRGPLKEDLVFKVLFLKRENVGYRYQFSEMNSESIDEPSFRWEVGDMNDCSARCGGGTQIARISCIEQKSGVVSDSFCIDMEKPLQPTQHCNMLPCITKWRTGKWGTCDACKGRPGVQKRGVECVQENPNPIGEAILVEDDRCPEPAPGTTKVCSSSKPCKGKRYIHHIPHSHLGDVWIKMQPKSAKNVYKRSENKGISENITYDATEMVSSDETDGIDETKSTLPLVCATADISSISTTKGSTIKKTTTTKADKNKDKISKQVYIKDIKEASDSKLFIYPLKKIEDSSMINISLSTNKDSPVAQFEGLEEDKKKAKEYKGNKALKKLKQMVQEGIHKLEEDKKKNVVNVTT